MVKFLIITVLVLVIVVIILGLISYFTIRKNMRLHGYVSSRDRAIKAGERVKNNVKDAKTTIDDNSSKAESLKKDKNQKINNSNDSINDKLKNNGWRKRSDK